MQNNAVYVSHIGSWFLQPANPSFFAFLSVVGPGDVGASALGSLHSNGEDSCQSKNYKYSEYYNRASFEGHFLVITTVGITEGAPKKMKQLVMKPHH